MILAFATGNREPPSDATAAATVPSRCSTTTIDPLFYAAIEATEEAIVNALLAAETMTGRDGGTAHALPHDRLLDVMRRFGRA